MELNLTTPQMIKLNNLKSFNTEIKIQKTSEKGANYFRDDIKKFNDYLFLDDFLNYKICKITFWYGKAYSPKPPIVNGIKFSYKHILTKNIVETKDSYGELELQGKLEFDLDDDEYIVNVTFRNGWIMDKLTFILNTNREISVGGEGGGYHKFDFKDSVILGSFGNYGQTLYNIGFYYISTEENQLNIFMKKRFLFILMKEKLKNKHKELQEQIRILKEQNNNDNFKSDIAFGKLCLQSKNIFASVILFVY